MIMTMVLSHSASFVCLLTVLAMYDIGDPGEKDPVSFNAFLFFLVFMSLYIVFLGFMVISAGFFSWDTKGSGIIHEISHSSGYSSRRFGAYTVYKRRFCIHENI